MDKQIIDLLKKHRADNPVRLFSSPSENNHTFKNYSQSELELYVAVRNHMLVNKDQLTAAAAQESIDHIKAILNKEKNLKKKLKLLAEVDANSTQEIVDAKNKEIELEKANWNNYFITQQQAVKDFDKLAKELKKAQQIINDIYAEAIKEDIEINENLENLIYSLIPTAITLILLTLSLAAPVAIAAPIGFLCFAVLMLALTLYALATSIAAPVGTLAMMMEQYSFGSAYIGMVIYEVVMDVMNYISIGLGVATLIPLGFNLYFGVKSALLASTTDEYFSKTIEDSFNKIESSIDDVVDIEDIKGLPKLQMS